MSGEAVTGPTTPRPTSTATSPTVATGRARSARTPRGAVRVPPVAPGGLQTPKRGSGSKFFNRPVEIDGLHFDSQAEGARYTGLFVALQMGEIRELEVHPKLPLVIHGEDCGYYEADFAYIVAATGERVLEDVKSPATRKLAVYRLKRRMVWAIYGLLVREVMA